MNERWKQGWLNENEGVPYGETLYRRAVGELPEMESAKAAAAQLSKLVRSNDHILDVGCGAGHYLWSINKRIDIKFSYTGIDATEQYIDLARKAFAKQEDVAFHVGDVFDLNLPDASADVVMSNNMLLHLPSIARPISELCRVARRCLLIRTLIGDRSFRIMDVADKDGDGDEFEASGEPKAYHYFNIYSRNHVDRLLRAEPRIKSFEIVEDTDFNPAAIDSDAANRSEARDVTRSLGGQLVNGCILQPWAFVIAELRE